MAGKNQHQGFLFFGTDEGLISDAASSQFSTLTEGTNEFSHEIIEATVSDSDGAASCIRQCIQALCTLPFFPGPKVVWMKNCNFLGDSITAKSATTDEAIQELHRILEGDLGPDISFIISATEFDQRRSFNKFLLKEFKNQSFNKPDISKDGWEDQLATIIENCLKEFQLSITRDAMELLVHRVSESSRQIKSEIQKIDLFLGEDSRQITIEHIQTMVPLTRTGIIFEISRALESKQSNHAIELIDFQLEKGENAVTIMRAAFIPTIRNLVSAKLLCDQYGLRPTNYKEFTSRVNSLPQEIFPMLPLKKDGTPNTWALFSAAQRAGNFKTAHLKKLLSQCAKADKALVSTSFDPRFILHRLAIFAAS